MCHSLLDSAILRLSTVFAKVSYGVKNYGATVGRLCNKHVSGECCVKLKIVKPCVVLGLWLRSVDVAVV